MIYSKEVEASENARKRLLIKYKSFEIIEELLLAMDNELLEDNVEVPYEVEIKEMPDWFKDGIEKLEKEEEVKSVRMDNIALVECKGGMSVILGENERDKYTFMQALSAEDGDDLEVFEMGEFVTDGFDE